MKVWFSTYKKPEKHCILGLSIFCTRQDSNLRPFGPEPNALSPELRVHRRPPNDLPSFIAWYILHGIGTDVKCFSSAKCYILISTVGRFQISSAYWRMVLSEENLPLFAVFMMAIFAHLSLSRYARSISQWART